MVSPLNKENTMSEASKKIARTDNEEDRRRSRPYKSFDAQLLRDEKTGCLEWIGALDKDGYGNRGCRWGQRRSHRFTYERHHGPIDSKKIVMHTCDNPKCCELSHLFLGTHQQNMADKFIKNRQAKGSANGNSILTENQVMQMRLDKQNGEKQVALARKYGVTVSSVSLIIKRKQWKHV
jgi:hypothetical protein